MQEFHSFFNNTSQISLVEFFLANNLALIFMFCNLLGVLNNSLIISDELSPFLNHTATPLFSKKLAFSSSCPGIGFIRKRGIPDARLSVVVNPPRFRNY